MPEEPSGSERVLRELVLHSVVDRLQGADAVVLFHLAARSASSGATSVEAQWEALQPVGRADSRLDAIALALYDDDGKTAVNRVSIALRRLRNLPGPDGTGPYPQALVVAVDADGKPLPEGAGAPSRGYPGYRVRRVLRERQPTPGPADLERLVKWYPTFTPEPGAVDGDLRWTLALAWPVTNAALTTAGVPRHSPIRRKVFPHWQLAVENLLRPKQTHSYTWERITVALTVHVSRHGPKTTDLGDAARTLKAALRDGLDRAADAEERARADLALARVRRSIEAWRTRNPPPPPEPDWASQGEPPF